MWTTRDLLSLRTAFLLLAVRAVRADCSADVPNALCCMGVAQYSTNSAVWGGICGYYPPAGDNPVVGARCIPYNTTSGWSARFALYLRFLTVIPAPGRR